jgi:hypothetical protein
VKLAAHDSFAPAFESPPLLTAYCFTALPSVGSPALFQAVMPPRRAAVSLKPFCLSVSAAPALVLSFGQVQ